MILAWILLALAVVMTGSLMYTWARLLIAEHKMRRRRAPARNEPRTAKVRRVRRMLVEPIIGR